MLIYVPCCLCCFYVACLLIVVNATFLLETCALFSSLFDALYYSSAGELSLPLPSWKYESVNVDLLKAA